MIGGRPLAFAASALLALFASAHSVVWLVVTQRIEDAIPAFVTSAAGQGWRLEGGKARRAGWPWAASVLIPSVSATGTGAGSVLRWQTQTLRLTISPLDPHRLALAAEGSQVVEAGGQTIPLQAAEAVLKLTLDGNGPAPFLVRDLQAGDASHGLAAASLTGQFTPLALELHAEGAALKPPLPPPFATPATLTLRVTTNQPFPPAGDPRAGYPRAGDPRAAAQAWREAGGTVSIPEVLLLWGPMTASGSGAARLDAALQPEGQLDLRLLGAPQALDAAAQSGLLRPNPAAASRAVLGLLTLAAGGGPIALPITLREQTLSVAQFPLLRTPSLEWGR